MPVYALIGTPSAGGALGPRLARLCLETVYPIITDLTEGALDCEKKWKWKLYSICNVCALVQGIFKVSPTTYTCGLCIRVDHMSYTSCTYLQDVQKVLAVSQTEGCILQRWEGSGCRLARSDTSRLRHLQAQTLAGSDPCTLRHLHAQTLARSDTCASASDVTCSLFYFVLFIDYFLFESLNILQQ